MRFEDSKRMGDDDDGLDVLSACADVEEADTMVLPAVGEDSISPSGLIRYRPDRRLRVRLRVLAPLLIVLLAVGWLVEDRVTLHMAESECGSVLEDAQSAVDAWAKLTGSDETGRLTGLTADRIADPSLPGRLAKRLDHTPEDTVACPVGDRDGLAVATERNRTVLDAVSRWTGRAERTLSAVKTSEREMTDSGLPELLEEAERLASDAEGKVANTMTIPALRRTVDKVRSRMDGSEGLDSLKTEVEDAMRRVRESMTDWTETEERNRLMAASQASGGTGGFSEPSESEDAVSDSVRRPEGTESWTFCGDVMIENGVCPEG